MSTVPMKTIVPRATRAWIKGIQIACTRYWLRCPAISVEAAAEEGAALGDSLLAALEDGTLLEMEPNVITHELDAGLVPSEFRDGPVFWAGCDLPAHIVVAKVTPAVVEPRAEYSRFHSPEASLPVAALHSRDKDRNRETAAADQAVLL